MNLTHIPRAYEDGDHVWLILIGMLVLHQLQQLAKSFTFLFYIYIQTYTYVQRDTIWAFPNLKRNIDGGF